MNDKTENKIRVKKWKIAVGLAFLLPIVIIEWALYSTFVLGFAIDKAENAVPGLDITHYDGSIAGGASLSGSYSDQNNRYAINGLEIQLGLKCLLRLDVCIESLYVENVELAFTSTEEEKPKQVIELPTVELPVGILLESLSVDALSILVNGNPVYQIKQVQAELTLIESQLTISSFAAIDDYCAWNLQGGVNLKNTYPLNSNLSCESQQGFGFLEVSLTESVENLNINAKAKPLHALLVSGGNVELEASVQPLQPSLPLNAKATLLETTVVNIGGDQQLSQTSNPSQNQNGKSFQIRLDKTEINLSSENLNADLDLTGELALSPWPGTHNINADLIVNNNEKNLQLQQLNWNLPEGDVQANGELSWDQGLHWSGPIKWNEVVLEYWHQAVNGNLSGNVETKVDYVNENLRANVNIANVDGTVKDQALMAEGQVQLENDQLTFNSVLIRADKTSVALNGTASPDSLDVNTTVNIPELKQWLAAAGGSVSSQIQIKGKPNDPSVQGSINGTGLRFNEIAAETITATLNWQALQSEQNRVEVSANKVQQNEFIGNVSFLWQGSLGDYQWQLDGNGLGQQEDKKLSTRCSGSWTQPVIEAHCDQIDLAFNYFDSQEQWNLTSPFDFSLDTQGQVLTLSQFCLSNKEQSICNDENVKLTPQSTDVAKLRASNLAVDWISPWLPENAFLDGTWNATFTLEDPFNTPIVSASLDSDSLSLEWRQEDRVPVNIQVQSLTANWVWRQQNQQHRHDLSWQLATQRNGSTEGTISLQGEQLSGELNLRQLQLAEYSRFILQQPRERIEGVVNSDFNLSGNLNKPLLNGGVTIKQGRVNTAALPIPIEEIDINLNVTDNTAKLDGSFIANEKPGSVGGTMFWSPENWNAELSLKAQDIGVRPDDTIEVFVSPDVQLKLSPLQVALTGTVQVPRAKVEIEELPEQAVSVSPDTIIVGDDDKESQQQQVSTNLKLVLGENVSFIGFGLETRITGNLTIHQEPGELIRGQGVLQLKDGRYKAYGQDLVIRNGDLVFVNDIDNPQLRMEAIREPLKTADDVIVGLRVSGAARNPKVALFSEPALAQQVQLSYMINGTAPGVENETDPTQLAAQSALSYALSSSAGEGLTQFAGRALGIDDLKVSTDSNENGTQIGLSGYVTPNLLVRYGVGVFDSVNSLTLKYRLQKNLYLKAVSGSSNALDLLWSFEKN